MKKIEIIIISLILLIAVFSITTDFNPLNLLAQLTYPDDPIGEVTDGGNVLKVISFIEGEEFNGLSVTQRSAYGNLESVPDSGMGGSTPYHRSHYLSPIKDIVLEAPSSGGGGVFSGWSGCDAESGRLCQFSITDNQTKKVEVHYRRVDPRLPLQLWSVSNNQITGGMPGDLWNRIDPAVAFKAANNQLTGQIPSSIGSLNALQLNLGRNELSGAIPQETGSMSNIEYLGFYLNDFSGQIPESLGGLSSLKYLLLYENNLSGAIPEDLGNLTNLVRFELHDNDLTGTVPENLSGVNSLIPSEMRFYNNDLDSIENGLISNSNWQGVNFNNNNFNKPNSMAALDDAAQRSGVYIDFCGNPTDGGTVRYDLDGDLHSTLIEDSVNNALEAGWDVYIPIRLEQRYEAYGPWRGSPCDPSPSCRSRTVTRERQIGYDDHEEPLYEEVEEEECVNRSSCNVPSYTGWDYAPDDRVVCARLTDPIYDISHVEPNSDGIPHALPHVSRYGDCNWWTNPEGEDCKPVCEFEQGSCPNSPPCGSPQGFKCEHEGNFTQGSGGVTGRSSIEGPLSGSCRDVHTTY